ncbi:hypothetical protein KP509_1Z152400 [Ceratopteris richardii]|nr:hypothetical protein KP509_1Z152400 [Ceratopteris richardii]
MALLKVTGEGARSLELHHLVRSQTNHKLQRNLHMTSLASAPSAVLLWSRVWCMRKKSLPQNVRLPLASSVQEGTLSSPSASPSPSNDHLKESSFGSTSSSSNFLSPPGRTVLYLEEFIEKSIFNCRFLTLLGIAGSLAGSILCFLKGCTFVMQSFKEYFMTCLVQGSGSGRVILLLVEAVDVYLMGTVMLIFGMGLYELFISTLDVPGGNCFASGSRTTVCGSNLFGLFRLMERPKWLEIRSLDELKTKLGHVIVMILLVGMFEKSKKVPIHSGIELLFFSASILFASGCLYVLSKLHSSY